MPFALPDKNNSIPAALKGFGIDGLLWVSTPFHASAWVVSWAIGGARKPPHLRVPSSGAARRLSIRGSLHLFTHQHPQIPTKHLTASQGSGIPCPLRGSIQPCKPRLSSYASIPCSHAYPAANLRGERSCAGRHAPHPPRNRVEATGKLALSGCRRQATRRATPFWNATL